MSKIELPSDELAEELQRHLQDKKFKGANYDKARRTLHFPDNMDPSEWSSLKSTVEKWTKEKHLDVVESLKVKAPRSEAAHEKAAPKEEGEMKKRLESLTPEEMEKRYNYLRSKSISELTDAEYDERLALVQRLSQKTKVTK